MAYEAGTRPGNDDILQQPDVYDDGGLRFRGPDGHMDAHTVAVTEADARGVDQTEKLVEALPQTADLGWNQDAGDMRPSLTDGMSNEDYWVLVRRFDNVRNMHEHTYGTQIIQLTCVGSKSSL